MLFSDYLYITYNITIIAYGDNIDSFLDSIYRTRIALG